MKYEKNQYSEGFSICALIIAGAFLYWGITSFIPWDEWSWWGFISTGIGLAILISQIFAITNRSKLRNVVLGEMQANPEATIEDIVRSTGITGKDVNAIILDLKASGQLRAKFNSATGQIKHLSIPEKEVVVGNVAKFCANCGTPISKEAAQFCAYCGAKI
ncbi:MAG: zinc ribbon domain-containing protein [Candidatus Hermodarchaeota archaeon]